MVVVTGITINDTVLVALVSGLIGFVPTYLGAILKFRKDLETEYDKDLRNDRKTTYKELWKLLEPLAFYVPPEPVTYQLIRNLMETLRQWYYRIGGIFLSENSRDAYFALMDELQQTLEENSLPETTLIAEKTKKRVKDKGSSLRTSLSRDIGSRRRPAIGNK
jgi:hypothetical protein